jgi:hypothetical protein
MMQFGFRLDGRFYFKEENPEARTAGRALIAEGRATGPKRRTFLFVNNRKRVNPEWPL